MTKLLNRTTSRFILAAAYGGAFLLAGCDTLASSNSTGGSPVSETKRPNTTGSMPRGQKAGDIKMTLLCPVGPADVAFNGLKFGSNQIEKIDVDISEPMKMDNGATVQRSNVAITSQGKEYKSDLTFKSPKIIALSFSGIAANQKAGNDIVQINYVMNLETGSFKRTASLFRAAASSTSTGSCRIAG